MKNFLKRSIEASARARNPEELGFDKLIRKQTRRTGLAAMLLIASFGTGEISHKKSGEIENMNADLMADAADTELTFGLACSPQYDDPKIEEKALYAVLNGREKVPELEKLVVRNDQPRDSRWPQYDFAETGKTLFKCYLKNQPDLIDQIAVDVALKEALMDLNEEEMALLRIKVQNIYLIMGTGLLGLTAALLLLTGIITRRSIKKELVELKKERDFLATEEGQKHAERKRRKTRIDELLSEIWGCDWGIDFNRPKLEHLEREIEKLKGENAYLEKKKSAAIKQLAEEIANKNTIKEADYRTDPRKLRVAEIQEKMEEMVAGENVKLDRFALAELLEEQQLAEELEDQSIAKRSK